WADALGGWQGVRVHAVPVATSRRRGVAWAEGPCGRSPQLSGQQERGAARAAGADGPQDPPGRATHRAGPAVRRLDGFPLPSGPILPGLTGVGSPWAALAWPQPPALAWPRQAAAQPQLPMPARPPRA